MHDHIGFRYEKMSTIKKPCVGQVFSKKNPFLNLNLRCPFSLKKVTLRICRTSEDNGKCQTNNHITQNFKCNMQAFTWIFVNEVVRTYFSYQLNFPFMLCNCIASSCAIQMKQTSGAREHPRTFIASSKGINGSAYILMHCLRRPGGSLLVPGPRQMNREMSFILQNQYHFKM